MIAGPDAIFLNHRNFADNSIRFRIGIIIVTKLKRSDRNGNERFLLLITAAIRQMLHLIQRSTFLTRIHDDLAGTDDIRAAGRGVRIALGKVCRTVNPDIGILSSAAHLRRRRRIEKVDICHVIRTAVGRTFAISTRAGRQIPLIVVKDIDVVSAAQRTGGAFFNDELHTGLQENILRHIDLTAVHSDGHIAVEGQYIIL